MDAVQIVTGVPNFQATHRGAWRPFDEAFERAPKAFRRRSMIFGGGLSFAVIAFFLFSIWLYRGWN